MKSLSQEAKVVDVCCCEFLPLKGVCRKGTKKDSQALMANGQAAKTK